MSEIEPLILKAGGVKLIQQPFSHVFIDPEKLSAEPVEGTLSNWNGFHRDRINFEYIHDIWFGDPIFCLITQVLEPRGKKESSAVS